MGKKLAIRGHATRGKEVIKLLEMMSGVAVVAKGSVESYCYYISENTATKYIFWDYIGPEEIDRYEIFTLEEFLEEYPHKVGDKFVDCYGNSRTIKSMRWLEDLETMIYAFEENSVVLAAKDIRFAYDGNTKQTEETITSTPDITTDVTDKNNCGIQCPDGYEFYDENGNLIGTKVMMRPKKPVYPKLTNLTECKEILGEKDIYQSVSGYRGELLTNFQRLLIFRNAYWKIAGEEMGLDKPWKPEYAALKDNTYFTIQTFNGEIDKSATAHRNAILAFPTEEMRDTFYENFKDLIEECKELL